MKEAWESHWDLRLTIGGNNELVPMITKVTPVNEGIMRLRIPQTPGVISVVSVYAPTGVSEFPVEKTFYARSN